MISWVVAMLILVVIAAVVHGVGRASQRAALRRWRQRRDGGTGQRGSITRRD